MAHVVFWIHRMCVWLSETIVGISKELLWEYNLDNRCLRWINNGIKVKVKGHLFHIIPMCLLNLAAILISRFTQQFGLLNTFINKFAKDTIGSDFMWILIIQMKILMKFSNIKQLVGSHHLRVNRGFFILH